MRKHSGKSRQGDEKLMAWLDPTIRILNTFSLMLRDGIGLVCCSTPPYLLPLFSDASFSPEKTIFTGVGVLLAAMKDFAAGHDTIVHLFERTRFFLQRLRSYTGIPLMESSTELLGKIMAQLLSILALSTKAMMDRRIMPLSKRIRPQGSSYKRKFQHGSLLRIPPSTITMRVKLTLMGPQLGLSKEPCFKIGNRMAPYCGSMAILGWENPLSALPL
ncbi:hypothetical protein F5148DRAFT_667015 [Russula earlei]|uniref:Uncharacterized protein n=1 Tax=Russula earlei TaxID=71964 RepID=A0ACC0UEJ6_9AGAM|nr:hypothetical protein F5148DRAFT_667015 [Russula earlei]